MSTISGTVTAELTLSQTAPNVTISGTIIGFGPAGDYSGFGSAGSATFAAAVFGAAGPDYTLHNQGLIKTHVKDATNIGILLGSTGTIFNTGTIIGGSGAAIFGSHAGAYVLNHGKIEAKASHGVGIFEQDAGTVVNAGTVIANGGIGAFGIELTGAGYAKNRGLINSSGDGIYVAGLIGGRASNVGIINAGSIGIYLKHGGILINNGQIYANENVIRSFGTSQIHNNGNMSDGAIGVEFTSGVLDNNGTISARNDAISAGYQDGTNVSSIYNFKRGHVSANNAIALYGTSYLYNAGIITAFQQAVLAHGTSFSILNIGTIEAAYQDGLQAVGSLKLTNAGLIEGPQGVLAFGMSDLDNRGTIIGATYRGVFASGTMQLSNQGQIAGSREGIVAGGYFTLSNGGKILSALGNGLAVNGNATIENSGLIEGGTAGITSSGTLAISNAGTIEGLSGQGITMDGLAVIGNPGLILGGSFGVDGSGTGLSISNTGTIAGAFGSGIGFNGDATIVNQRLIAGLNEGISTAGYLNLSNYGTIVGTLATGVTAAGGAYIINNGEIFSLRKGVSIADGLALRNAGTIVGTDGTGVVEYSGNALITNSGVIESKGMAVSVGDGDLFLVNSGTISGTVAIGMSALTNSVSIENSGLLEGELDGINIAGSLALENSGTIMSRDDVGAAMFSGQVTNAAGGRIEGIIGVAVYTGAGLITNNGVIAGTGVGIDVVRGGTIIDTSTISGPNAAIRFTYSYNNRLIINSSADLIGSVAMGGGTLELSAGGTAGTIDVASEFTGLNAVKIDSGAVWDITGPTIAATLQITNDGLIKSGRSGHQTIDATLEGHGTVEIGSHTLALNGSADSGQRIVFTGANEVLSLGQISTFEGRIAEFVAGDTIDLSGIALSSIEHTAFSSGVLTIATNFNTYNLTFANLGTFAADNFNIFADGHGTGITLSGAQMKFLSTTVINSAQTQFPQSFAMPLDSIQNAPAHTNICAAQYGWSANDMFKPRSLDIVAAMTLQS